MPPTDLPAQDAEPRLSPRDASAPARRLRDLKAAGRRIVALTAYDYPTARILDESGVDLILVGDSLGMVVLGHPDTTSVTIEDMEHHTRACRRGVQSAILAADLPIRTYDDPASAAANARRLAAAGAEAVKLEGGAEVALIIRAVVETGIPCLGHVGMLPQRVREEGGYKKKGRSPAEVRRLVDDAVALEAAGACAIVIESAVPEAASAITRSVAIPTIGIGAGTGTDGQIRVIHDIIGAFPWFTPPFVTPAATVAEDIRSAVGKFADDVRNGCIP